MLSDKETQREIHYFDYNAKHRVILPLEFVNFNYAGQMFY
jgi:hypothetical protein